MTLKHVCRVIGRTPLFEELGPGDVKFYGITMAERERMEEIRPMGVRFLYDDETIDGAPLPKITQGPILAS